MKSLMQKKKKKFNQPKPGAVHKKPGLDTLLRKKPFLLDEMTRRRNVSKFSHF